jgi:serine/threonine-protein kinase
MLPEFQIGDTVGDYQIIGLLGKGGMGKVFQVRNRLSDRVEAMKVILPGLEDDPGLAERFMREIKLQASLEHPNIAALRTALQVGSRILMIMEFIDGASLQERLRNGPLPIGDAVDCVRQVLRALAFAHARHVIHRDVKPPNIILTPAGLAKLTDFGIARSVSDHSLTGTGMAVGSLLYMSPEQIQGHGADARSDLYSVGITLYESVTGKRPFDGANEYAIMQAHLAGDPVSPSELNREIGPALSALILNAIARAPDERFQTAFEFEGALAGMGMQATVASVPALTFDAAELARVEANLRPALGPISRHVVTDAARQCSTLEQLHRRLADQIPDTRQREAFLRRSEGEGAATRMVATKTPVPAVQTPVPSAPVWDPMLIETLKQKLAAYLGPIAPVMVNRQMRRAKTIQELYQALAAEIPSERDRQAFLESLR